MDTLNEAPNIFTYVWKSIQDLYRFLSLCCCHRSAVLWGTLPCWGRFLKRLSKSTIAANIYGGRYRLSNSKTFYLIVLTILLLKFYHKLDVWVEGRVRQVCSINLWRTYQMNMVLYNRSSNMNILPLWSHSRVARYSDLSQKLCTSELH